MNYMINYIKKYGLAYALKKVMERLGVREIALEDMAPVSSYNAKISCNDYINELEMWYSSKMNGASCNLANPLLFTEKVQWLKLNDYTKIKSDLSDKYKAPLYVSEKCGGLLNIIKQHGVWDDARKIDFDSLPRQFVLKCNHGCGMNIIVKDKAKINKKRIVKRLNRWLDIDFAFMDRGSLQIQYHYIERRIIAEKYIEEIDGGLKDYKIHCFNGQPRMVQVIGDRNLEKHTGKQSFYDIDWKKLNFTFGDYPPFEHDIERPISFERMLEASKILSGEFKYVRVDLYEIGGEPYFGELTFTPASGIYPLIEPDEGNLWLGNMLEL